MLGKRGRPKRATTISGSRRVRDLAKSDIAQAMKDIMAGKTRANVKADRLLGRAIVRGGAGTAARTIGLFGGVLTYAAELGIIEQNPVSQRTRSTLAVSASRSIRRSAIFYGRRLRAGSTKPPLKSSE